MSSPRFCSECGKPLEAGHRFCRNCGATTSGEADVRTTLTSDQTVLANEHVQSSQSQVPAPQVKSDSMASTIITPNSNALLSQPETPDVSVTSYSTVSAPGNQFYTQATDADVIPPPPPPDSLISAPQEAPAVPYYTPFQQSNEPVPAYAKAPKRSRGCLITSVVLLLVLVLGAFGGFYIIKHNNSNASVQNGSNSSGQQNTSSASVNTPTSIATTGSNGNRPNTGGSTTVPLNLKFTYSSVDITLVSVQQANSFSDDTSAPQGGVRVIMMESNSTSNDSRFLYNDVVRLIMPDGSINTPSNERYSGGPDSGVSRNNWIDFAVSSQNINLSKLVLGFGSATENQMSIPLLAGADLSKYQSKTVSPNSTFQYADLKWTLTSATESLSANGIQAATGMIYVTITLTAVNSSTHGFTSLPTDYMRLQAADSKNAPTTDYTFPLSVASQSSGTGTATFPMMQGGTSFTLLMLAQQASPPINAASVTFQFQ